jgi:ATP/maltotriose-dependent transcriptional regulator MalT
VPSLATTTYCKARSKITEATAAPLAGELLSAPRLKVLATSRIPLGVYGEYERAEAFLREAQEMYRELGQGSGVALANSLLGFLALSRNDPDRAEELCVEAIRELQEMAQTPDVVYTLNILAGVAASRGEIRRAARLWGAAAGFREAIGAPWIPDERAMIEPHIEAARTRLDEAIWREEWEKGRSMTLDQAVGYALQGSGERAMERG